jgi:hypothetical protein
MASAVWQPPEAHEAFRADHGALRQSGFHLTAQVTMIEDHRRGSLMDKETRWRKSLGHA